MRLPLAMTLAVLLALPLAADARPPDPDEFSYCAQLGPWEVCVSRDNTWYCYRVWTGMPPAIEDCFQFIGP